MWVQCSWINQKLLISLGDNYEIAKTHWHNLKKIFSRTTGPISTKLGTMHPWVTGIKVYSNEGPHKLESTYWFDLFSNASHMPLGLLCSMLSSCELFGCSPHELKTSLDLSSSSVVNRSPSVQKLYFFDFIWIPWVYIIRNKKKSIFKWKEPTLIFENLNTLTV